MNKFSILISLCLFSFPFLTMAEIHTALQISQKRTRLEFIVTIKNSEKTSHWFSLPSQAEILQLDQVQQDKTPEGLRKIKVLPETQVRLQYLTPYDLNKTYYLSSLTEVWHPIRISNDPFVKRDGKNKRSTASPLVDPIETFSIKTSLLPDFAWIHSATGVSQQSLSYVFGRFKSYSGKDGRIRIYLMEADDKLARTLIEHLENYLKHFENLYGAYPYDYFAVVESSDEVGYAFPKMTWMGSRLLRFPFILKTSLPHELLHSWWGNGVFVDYGSGNWCEGLTAFGSDYGLLSPEEKKLYRLKALTNYMNYVKEDKEISLAEFVSRGEDRSLQAIGYDKAMMIFVMLEQILGEKDFNKSLRSFYQRFKYQTASWQDIFDVMSQVSQREFKTFRDYWIHSNGSLDEDFIQLTLKTKEQKSTVVAKGISAELNKILGMKVEASVQFPSNRQNLHLSISKNKPELENSSLIFAENPLSYTLDPQFYLFRGLDELELPTTFSKFFGAAKAALKFENQKWYDFFQQAFTEKTWKRLDSINDFHKDQSIITSFEIAFAHPLLKDALAKRKIQIAANSIEIEGQNFSLQNHSVFVMIRVQNTFVTLVHLGEEQSPVRWLQRWSRYGAQGYVVLNQTSASLQGLWLDPFEIPFSPTTY